MGLSIRLLESVVNFARARAHALVITAPIPPRLRPHTTSIQHAQMATQRRPKPSTTTTAASTLGHEALLLDPGERARLERVAAQLRSRRRQRGSGGGDGGGGGGKGMAGVRYLSEESEKGDVSRCLVVDFEQGWRCPVMCFHSSRGSSPFPSTTTCTGPAPFPPPRRMDALPASVRSSTIRHGRSIQLNNRLQPLYPHVVSQTTDSSHTPHRPVESHRPWDAQDALVFAPPETYLFDPQQGRLRRCVRVCSLYVYMCLRERDTHTHPGPFHASASHPPSCPL